MIDKVSGNVAYAIMSFGGFLGIGNSYHPLPWSLLQTPQEQRGTSVTRQYELEGTLSDDVTSPIGTIPNTKPKSTIMASALTRACLELTDPASPLP